jgi:hypothetical protein
MTFTQDELQALNVIFDQKTKILLNELEQFFDQRIQILQNKLEQYQQQLEDSIQRSFAAQLLTVEQLINQSFPASNSHIPVLYTNQPQTNFEAIEVQTEIPWEDLIDLLNKALNERFITLNTSLQARLRDVEHEVSSQIQLLRNDLRKHQPVASSSGKYGNEAEMQDILTSINQLKCMVESLQEQAHPSRPFSPTEQERFLERE